MRNTKMLVLLVVAALLLTGCAAGPNTAAHIAAAHKASPAGFWLGLWHGVISPFTFIYSLFNNRVNFYEVHNNGSWYNFGFVMGAGILFGGGGSAISRSRS